MKYSNNSNKFSVIAADDFGDDDDDCRFEMMVIKSLKIYRIILPVGGIKAKISFHGKVKKCMM